MFYIDLMFYIECIDFKVELEEIIQPIDYLSIKFEEFIGL